MSFSGPLNLEMFDFEKNDYEVKEIGKDFWGRRKFQIIEKPKTGCGGTIVVLLILFFLVKMCGDSSDSQDNISIRSSDADSHNYADERIVDERINDAIEALEVESKEQKSDVNNLKEEFQMIIDQNTENHRIEVSQDHSKPIQKNEEGTVIEKINNLRNDGYNDRQIRKKLNLSRQEWKRIVG